MFLKLLHFSAKWNGGFNERSSWNLSSGRDKLEPFNSRNWTIKSVIVWSWVVQQWIFSCLLFGEIYSGKPGGQSHSFSCNVCLCPGDFFKKSIRLEIQNERNFLCQGTQITNWILLLTITRFFDAMRSKKESIHAEPDKIFTDINTQAIFSAIKY